MKSKLSIFLFLVFVYSSTIYSQDITEVVENMSIGQHNAVILNLPYDVKFVDTVWKDYLKTFKGKSRKVKKSDEVFTDDASISYISNNTVDIYSVVLKSGEGAQLKMWMDLGGGFVDSQNFPDESFFRKSIRDYHHLLVEVHFSDVGFIHIRFDVDRV